MDWLHSSDISVEGNTWALSYIDMVAAVVIQPLHPFMTLLKTDIIFNKRLETRYDRCGTLQRDVRNDEMRGLTG